MNIEEKLRGALDTPAPPPTTTLDHVLRRGRRRVFAQRAGALLGVAAVVVGIGVGSTALNHAGPDRSSADQPNPDSATVEHVVGWPRVNVSPQTPYETWTPAAGRPVPPLPRCVAEEPKIRIMSPGVPQSADFLGKWEESVRRTLPEMQVGERQNYAFGSYHRYSIDLTDEDGAGSVMLMVGRFEGSPQVFADNLLWTTGDCEPPYRKVLPDGTVVQLHGVHPSEPFQSLTQFMYVFRPDGVVFSLELRNWSSKDVRVVAVDVGDLERVGPGRATMPLTEEQFSRLGPAIAGVA
ncbi:hypothetical protein ABZX92_08360 [Lentzea sp. NPDC006480]|uniref:hypothetical protein n=1 Tax=Lentzea sp. NPDC006480 TaxID=3157176 RepID=UPI0033ABD8CB